MGKILFGTAGIPISAGNGNSIEGIKKVAELGLQAMELEFVYGVKMGKETAKEVNAVRKKTGVELTVHAPYYVNLNSEEKEKIAASRKRILDSARIGALCGAQSVTFHSGFYQKKSEKETMETIEEQLTEILKQLKKERIDIAVAPETTGKRSQFGSLEESLELVQGVKGLRLCVDFAHLHARCNGCLKTEKDFTGLLEKIEAAGKKLLKGLHMHCSGINYSEKGERNHLTLKDSDFNFKALMKALKEFGVGGWLICESPNLEEDALLMKKCFESLD